jgi:hypothetical protein
MRNGGQKHEHCGASHGKDFNLNTAWGGGDGITQVVTSRKGKKRVCCYQTHRKKISALLLHILEN